MADSPIRVTIKHDKGYEATWTVFSADTSAEAVQHLVEHFGLDPEAIAGMTPHEVVVLATNIAHGVGTARKVLKATPVADAVEKAARVAKPAEAKPAEAEGEDPWAAPTTKARFVRTFADREAHEFAPPPEPGEEWDPILQAIEDASSKKALQLVFARYNDAFKEREDVRDAFKAKAAALAAS